MSRLSKLYQAMQTLQHEGLQLSAEQEKQLRLAEQEIIQKEILPVISEKIAPILSQIERELVLVVDYAPGPTVKVSLSRRRNLADVLSDAVEIKADPKVSHRSLGPHTKTKLDIAPKSGLRVTMPNGNIIFEKSAKDTFIQTILSIGINKVRPLGIYLCGVPLISNTRDEKYGGAQHHVGGGWMIITHSNTLEKKRILDKIARLLNLNIVTQIIK